MRGHTLGVDPGTHGGAVLTGDRGEPLRALAWGPVAAGIRLRSWRCDGDGVEEVLRGEDATPYMLGRRCAALCPEGTRVGYEGLFVGQRTSSSAPSTLALAEWVGEHRAGLVHYDLIQRDVVVVESRPLAQQWRRDQLGRGWGQARRDEAEAYAVRVASEWLPAWSRKERGAIAEAWLIARHIARLPGVGAPISGVMGLGKITRMGVGEG